MDGFECPACGYTNEPSEENTGEPAKCFWCGADPANPKHSKAPEWPTQFSGAQEDKRPEAWKLPETWIHPETWNRGFQIAAALGLAAVVVFGFMNIGSLSAKTPMHELNYEEVDSEILEVGISALEGHGWTEPETAGYIDSRIRVYKVENQRASNWSLQIRARDESKLKIRSTASELEDLGKSDRRKVQEEIEERDAMIQGLQRVLNEYRQAPESESAPHSLNRRQ